VKQYFIGAGIENLKNDEFYTQYHDTEKDTNTDNNISAANKMKAYAYILTHDGYPTLFYSD